MEVFVARQPIFDQNMQLYGYELLYRRNNQDFFDGTDDGQATADLINNAFLTLSFNELTHGTRAFINFPKDLIEKEIPLLLPKDKIVVEIIERGLLSTAFLKACRKLKKAGYHLALDNFVPNAAYLPLLELVDIVKVDFSAFPPDRQAALIKKLPCTLLAQKLETRESFQQAKSLGYSLFQGYFFTKPVTVSGKEISVLSTNLVRMTQEINCPEPSFERIAEIVDADLGLTYKFLKLANSVVYGSIHRIGSVHQALVRLGISEIRKLAYIMMVKGITHVENRELVKNSLIRARLMELFAMETGIKLRTQEFFTTGILSAIDVLLNKPMEDIVHELPLTEDIKNALLGEHNGLRQMLNKVILLESGQWDKNGGRRLFNEIPDERLMSLYLEALEWVMELDY